MLHKTLCKKLEDRGIKWWRPEGCAIHYAENGRRRLAWFVVRDKIVCLEGCHPRRIDASFTLMTNFKSLRNIRQAIDFIVGKL